MHMKCNSFRTSSAPMPSISQPPHLKHIKMLQGVIKPSTRPLIPCTKPAVQRHRWSLTKHKRHTKLAYSSSSASASNTRYDPFNVPGLNPPTRLERNNNLLTKLLLHPLHAVISRFVPALASTELLRRLAVTLVCLACIRLGHFIPIPGIAHTATAAAASSTTTTTAAVAATTTDTFYNIATSLFGSSGAGMFSLPSEVTPNIFELSITPLMTAYLTISLIGAVPGIRRHFTNLRERGRQGRKELNSYTNGVFVVAAVVQAWTSINSSLLPTASAGSTIVQGATEAMVSTESIHVVQSSNFGLKCSVGLNLVAGAVLCKYFVQCIDTWGLGDGTGAIIGAGIALGYLQHLQSMIPYFLKFSPPPHAILLALFLIFSLIAVTVKVQSLALQLPLVFYKPRKSQKQQTHPVLSLLRQGVDAEEAVQNQARFPMRLSPSRTRQLLFANFWVALLQQKPLSYLGLGPFVQNPYGFALLVFIMESLSIGDATPKQMAEYLSSTDSGIRGLSPGIDTERFLALRRNQLKLINAAFIASVSLLARAVDIACVYLIGVHPSCLSVLLLVSTVLGASRQVDALSRGPRVERMIQTEFSLIENVAGGGGDH